MFASNKLIGNLNSIYFTEITPCILWKTVSHSVHKSTICFVINFAMKPFVAGTNFVFSNDMKFLSSLST